MTYAPPTYTIPETRLYITTDTKDSYAYKSGDVIPYPLAVRFGIASPVSPYDPVQEEAVTVHFGKATVSTSSVEIAPANPERVKLTIQNRSGATIYINTEGAAVLGGWRVDDGDDYLIGGGQAITAITQTGTVEVNVSWEVRNG